MNVSASPRAKSSAIGRRSVVLRSHRWLPMKPAPPVHDEPADGSRASQMRICIKARPHGAQRSPVGPRRPRRGRRAGLNGEAWKTAARRLGCRARFPQRGWLTRPSAPPARPPAGSAHRPGQRPCGASGSPPSRHHCDEDWFRAPCARPCRSSTTAAMCSAEWYGLFRWRESGTGAAFACTSLALVPPMPSTWPPQSGLRGNGSTCASKTANLMLDEPQLRTRIGTLMPATRHRCAAG